MIEKFKSIIYASLTELNEINAGTVPESITDETPLYGEGSALDSLSLVSLVIAIEQAIEDDLGVSISLADDKAMSQANSPFRSITSLAKYADKIFNEG